MLLAGSKRIYRSLGGVLSFKKTLISPPYFHREGCNCKLEVVEMEYFSPVQPQTKKVSNDIPEDLAFSILTKLSLKSLLRFGCVRKSWTLLFRNPYFMSLYLKNLLYHTSLLLLQNMSISDGHKCELYSLSGEMFENKTKLDWPNPFQDIDPEFYVVGSGSIHGVLCLICCSQPDDRVVLWNPTTKEFKVIPTSLRENVRYMDVEFTRYGFAYDSINDDYKVIRQVMHNRNSETDSDTDDLSLDDCDIFWEIYSLRSNSWEKHYFDLPYDYRGEGMSLDGACHWLGEDGYDDDNDDEVYLLSIDLRKEDFHITPISSEDDGSWKDLFVLNGSIALISVFEEMNTFYISVLGELYVKESWTKLYNLCPLLCIERPIEGGKKGYIFPKVLNNGKQICLDFNTLMAEKLSLVRFSKSIVYEESSLPIGGINQ